MAKKKKKTKRNNPQRKPEKKKFGFKFKKKTRSKEEQKRTKKRTIIILIVLAVAIFLASIPFIANAVVRAIHRNQLLIFEPATVESQLTPGREADGSWTFVTPRDFKVMQLSDLEIAGGFLSTMEDSSAFNTIETMISMEAPDLLVVTGDLVHASLSKSGAANNMAALKIVAQMIDSLEVYWTVTLGDGDEMGTASRREIAEYLASEELKFCLFEIGDENVDGFGNNIIKIKNVEGKIIQAIYSFDTHGKSDETIKPSQIEWYKTSLEKLNEENEKHLKENETTKTLAFMHKPLEEFKLGYEATKTKGADNIKLFYGYVKEDVGVSEKSDDLFETMLELKSTQGIFCGHDHLNTMSMEYEGIRLTYCGSIDYLDYDGIDTLGKQRNCTIVDIDLENSSFDCRSENFYQDRYISYFEKGEVTDIK